MSGRPGSLAPARWSSGGSLLAVAGVITFLTAAAMVRLPLVMSGLLVVGVALFITTFVSTQAGLYLVVLSMLLSPEIGLGGLGGSSATTASRGLTIRTEDLALVVLGFAWLAHMAVHKELGLVRRTPLNRRIGSYIAACLFATTMGSITGHVDGVTGLFYVLKYVEYFVIYFMVANYLRTRAQVHRLVLALLLTGLIVSLMAMAQMPSGERVSAPFEGERGEPNTLGGYLLFVACLAGGLLLQQHGRAVRWALGGFIVLLLIPFLATLSRGSYVALPFAYLTLAILHRRRRASMLALLVLFLAVGAVVLPDAVRQRVAYTVSQERHAGQVRVGGVALDTSTSARLQSWAQAGQAALHSPLWGYGVTGYGFLDAQYPRILVETGILGLVFFAALVRGILRESLAVFRGASDPLFRGLAMGTIAGTVGLLVHAVGANTFIIVRIMEPFWLTVGLVVCAGRLEQAPAEGSAS
ncbi:MAG: O-antigen ligase family protein [Candidatus Latescibacterota bacterium]